MLLSEVNHKTRLSRSDLRDPRANPIGGFHGIKSLAEPR
jgi:hypothetical protein